jgi:hypothetical protein
MVARRYYLFTNDGLKRLSNRLLDDLVSGRDALPQYSGTKLKFADVAVGRGTDGSPEPKIVSAYYFEFDASGSIRAGLERSTGEAVNTYGNLLQARFRQDRSVVDLGPKLNRRKWEREHLWTVSKTDFDCIAADIGAKGKDAAEFVKGVSPARPPLTEDARRALSTIGESLSNIAMTLENLSEPALKGLAFEAKERGVRETDPMLSAVATVADGRREIKARHRTGRGTWFAVIEATRWEKMRKFGEITVLAHEEHRGKRAAVAAARRLLAEHAKRFDYGVSVEASVYCDLEWDPELDNA